MRVKSNPSTPQHKIWELLSLPAVVGVDPEQRFLNPFAYVLAYLKTFPESLGLRNNTVWPGQRSGKEKRGEQGYEKDCQKMKEIIISTEHR
jgi:hypothetical protein